MPPKTIGTLTNMFCILGPNLVILAWTGDELSRGQTWWRADGRTDAGNDNTRRPKLASGNKTVGLIIEFPVIWNTMTFMWLYMQSVYIEHERQT